MARKYARDNRGRFASGGGGATARGGRLKTASGNKRATQTMKAAGAGGVIKGRTARTVAGEKVMAKLAKRAPAAKRISAARPGGTVAKPAGLKPGAIKPKAAAPKPATRAKGAQKVDEAKVSRIAERIRNLNTRNEGKGGKARIRALNRSEVRQRAIEFMRGKKGVQAVTAAQVAKTINSRKKTSTGSGSGGVMRGKYDNLGQSKIRQQRAERMKSGYDDASIARRMERVRKRTEGRLVPQASVNAAEIYKAQLSGRMARGRGAELPGSVRHQLQNARYRQRPDGSVHFESARTNNIMRGSRPSYGAPVKGDRKLMRSTAKPSSTVGSGGSNKANARGRAQVLAKAKMDPMQRHEANYQKKKHGVHSTISNPGRPSRRLPRRTSVTGARVAVRGGGAATRRAYRTRVGMTLNQTRQGSLGMGRVRRNPRMQKQQTGMAQLSLMGRATPLVRYKRV